MLRKYATILRVNFSQALAYRSQVVGRMVFYTVFIFVFFNLWRAIFEGGEMNGYTLTQMLWYLCCTEFVTFASRNNLRTQINDDIKTGNIAYQLGRPIHYVAYQLVSALGGVLLNTLVFAGLGIALALVFVGPLEGFRFWMLAPVLCSALIGMGINFLFEMLISLTSFVLEENSAAIFVYSKFVFMLGVFLPIEFLPGWLQTLARNLPFSYIAWAPSKLLVDFSWPLFWDVVPKQLFWLACVSAVTMLAFTAGRKRVQANGG